MSRVFVTGLGVVSPLGVTIQEFSRRMFAGDSGVVSILGTLVDASFPVPYAALVDRGSLANRGAHHHDASEAARWGTNAFWLFSVLAGLDACSDLKPGQDVEAIFSGTAEGISFDTVFESLKAKTLGDIDFDVTRSETSLELLAQALVSRRVSGSLSPRHLVSVNSACASGNQAIGLAWQHLKAGKFKRVLAGGVDARCSPSNLMNFHMLGALGTRPVKPSEASCPFSGERDGFVRGEGSGFLLLETEEALAERNATPLAEVLGYGMTSDAYRLTDGRDDCLAVVQAMRTAVASAGLSLEDINYINAHGTSTKLNDRLETKAIKELFAQRAYQIPVSSLKSQLGHSTTAAGAIEAVACVLMLREQCLAPTLNYRVADPECDLDYVPNYSRKTKVSKILSNNFGFGGQNACVVFGAV